METIIIAGILSLVAYFLGHYHGLKSGVRLGAFGVFKALVLGGMTMEQIEEHLRAAKAAVEQRS
jgi:hypothetical protein